MPKRKLEIEIKADGKQAIREMDKVSGKAEKTGVNIGASIAKGAVIAAAAIGTLVFAMSKAVDAANEQEAAEKSLEVALGRTSQSLLDQASALQKVTAFGDETIIKAQALIAAFVKDEDQIKAATAATLDLAAAKGFDLVQAADLVAKTLGSSTNALSRYGIEVTGAVGSTERLASLTGNLEKVFGGQARGQVETFGGATKQLSNAFGDVVENVGFFITKNKAMISAVQDLTRMFGELATSMSLSDEVDEFDRLNVTLQGLEVTRKTIIASSGTIENKTRSLLQVTKMMTAAQAEFDETVQNNIASKKEEEKAILAVSEARTLAAEREVAAAELTKSLTGDRPSFETEDVSEVEKLREANELKLQEIALFNERELELMRQLGLDKDLIAIEEADRRLLFAEQVAASEKKIKDLQKKQEKDLNNFKLKAAQGTASNLLSVMQAFGKGSSKVGKALFLVEKGLAISRAIVATELAATQALALPPAPNAVAAGFARAQGYAGVAAIAATAFSGGGGGSKGGGGGGGSLGSGDSSGGISPSGVPKRIAEEEVQAKQEINITFQTDGIIAKDTLAQMKEDLIATINEGGTENLLINANVIAANA